MMDQVLDLPIKAAIPKAPARHDLRLGILDDLLALCEDDRLLSLDAILWCRYRTVRAKAEAALAKKEGRDD